MASSPHNEPWWLETTKTIGLSLLLAFGIRTYVAEARYIPSGSMEPTLQVNDRLIIEKISYYFRPPERGDIMVFSPTTALKEQGFHDAFIKRVIGIPGDRVKLKNGSIFVNHHRLSESYDVNHAPTLIDACQGKGPNGGLPFLSKPQTIPKDSFLVLGDNRTNSYDGRCWGLVSKNNLVGRAWFRFWPLNRVGALPDLHSVFKK